MNPDRVALLSLLELPGMGPIRLELLLACGSPMEMWRRVCGGQVPSLVGVPRAVCVAWPAAARKIDLAAQEARYARAGVDILAPHDPVFPRRLRYDAEAPPLLFAFGASRFSAGPVAAVIGTRRATRYGLDMAHLLGHDLRALGVTVVSGLAAGIDGAAHRGALSATTGPAPVGIVGSGLDRPYPQVNRRLWRDMATTGVLFSEAPLGSAPEPWRFPARNRLIAALSDVVVIVESYESGGSLITAEYADARDRTLLAVPGSAFSPASVGTHDLLRTKDAWLCTSAADVLVALKLAGSTGSNDARQSESESEPEVRVPSEDHETVLALLCWEPTSFHDLARHATFALPKLAGIVEDLVSLGFCDNRDGSLVRSRRAAQSLNRGKSFP